MKQKQDWKDLRIKVSEQAKDAMDAAVERYGMSNQEMASRIYMWFTEQPEYVQVAVLDIYPREHTQEIASLIMAKMAEKPHAIVDDAETE